MKERKVKWFEDEVMVVGNGARFTIPTPPKGSDVESFMIRYGVKQWTSDNFASEKNATNIADCIKACFGMIASGKMPERSRTAVPATTKIMSMAQSKGLSPDEMALLQKLLSKLA